MLESPSALEQATDDMRHSLEQLVAHTPDAASAAAVRTLATRVEAALDAMADAEYNVLDIEPSATSGIYDDSLVEQLNTVARRHCGGRWGSSDASAMSIDIAEGLPVSVKPRQAIEQAYTDFYGLDTEAASCLADSAEPTDLGLLLGAGNGLDVVVRAADHCGLVPSDFVRGMLHLVPDAWSVSLRNLLVDDIADPEARDCAAVHLGKPLHSDRDRAISAMRECGLTDDEVDSLADAASNVFDALFAPGHFDRLSADSQRCLMGFVDQVLDATASDPGGLYDSVDSCVTVGEFLLAE